MSNLFRQLFVNLWLSAIFLLTATYIQTSYAADNENIENEKPALKILRDKGYEAEYHVVTTEDKYKLELHHITKNYFEREASKNFPVLIQHCLLGSSADYVIADREQSLPMVLADAGYDVWLANSRGNLYSREHEDPELTHYSREFWDFSFQELAIYDLPATINFILDFTGKEQLTYVGFSMGTTVFYIMASEMPEYSARTIRAQISLAPAANISHSTSIFKNLASFALTLHKFANAFLSGCLMSESTIVQVIMSILCSKLTLDVICLQKILYKVGGYDPEHLDTALIPQIIDHYPSGTSTKLGVHYSQFILTDHFGKIDLGETENLNVYRSNRPPKYDLSKIKVPITLIYAQNDILSPPEDVKILASKLNTKMDVIKVDSEFFNHMDFLWAKDVTYHINNRVRETLDVIDDPYWQYKGPILTKNTIIPLESSDSASHESFGSAQDDTDDIDVEIEDTR